MNLRLERRLALAVAFAAMSGASLISTGLAHAENSVAPAIVLRQQASGGATTSATGNMQQAMADAAQIRPRTRNATTEAK